MTQTRFSRANIPLTRSNFCSIVLLMGIWNGKQLSEDSDYSECIEELVLPGLRESIEEDRRKDAQEAQEASEDVDDVEDEDEDAKPRRKRRKRASKAKNGKRRKCRHRKHRNKKAIKWWNDTKTVIRYCPRLRHEWKLTVAESLLAHVLVAYSTLYGRGKKGAQAANNTGKKGKRRRSNPIRMCGGNALVPARLIRCAVSNTVYRKINIYLKNLQDKGVLRSFVGLRGKYILANVSGKFARAVRRSKFYIKDLDLWDFNWDKDSPMYEAPATAKLMVYVWRHCVQMCSNTYIRTPEWATIDQSESHADVFPRTNMLSRWMGISRSQVKRVLAKYAYKLFEVEDIYIEDPAPNGRYRNKVWGDHYVVKDRPRKWCPYAKYAKGIRRLTFEVYKFKGHMQLLHMLDYLKMSYERKLAQLWPAYGIKFGRQEESWKREQNYRLYEWHEWATAINDNPGKGYRMYKKRVTNAFKSWYKVSPPLPKNPVFGAEEEVYPWMLRS